MNNQRGQNNPWWNWGPRPPHSVATRKDVTAPTIPHSVGSTEDDESDLVIVPTVQSPRNKETIVYKTEQAQDSLTLRQLARICGIELSKLQQENPDIDSNELLQEGQTLTICDISSSELNRELKNYRDAFCLLNLNFAVQSNSQQQTFGDYLKHLRLIASAVQRKDITQKQLAKKLGYSGSALANIETGNKPPPSDRNQHLTWIKVFVKLGVINTIGMANQWLNLLDFRFLDKKEQEEIFGQSGQYAKNSDSTNKNPLVTITLKKEEWFSTPEERDQYLTDFQSALTEKGIVATVEFAVRGSINVFVDVQPDQIQKIFELLTSDPEMREKYPVEGIILSHANFRDKDFSGSNFVGGNFSGAVLQNVRLHGSDLSSTLFVGADLRSADLTSAILVNANLSFADLRGTNLTGVDLQTVNLDYVLFDDSTKWVKPAHFKDIIPVEHLTNSSGSNTASIRLNDNARSISATADLQSSIADKSEDPINSKDGIPQFLSWLSWLKWILISLPLLVLLIYTDPLGLTLGALLGTIGFLCNIRLARFIARPMLKYILISLTFITTLFVYLLIYGILD